MCLADHISVEHNPVNNINEMIHKIKCDKTKLNIKFYIYRMPIFGS